jgi:kynurenine formamidase
MCSPEIIAQVAAHMSLADRPGGAAARTKTVNRTPRTVSFSRVVDLTHLLPSDFPNPFGRSNLDIEPVLTFAKDGVNLNNWHISEHVGTHIDAPIHFSDDGLTVEQIPVQDLVVPLAIIDIRERAEANADTELTPDDIAAWEAQYGSLPAGCCVAMNSGWDRFAPGPRYCDRDDDDVMHFPGFHGETAEMLVSSRDVLGLGVDTTSLDNGPSTEFLAHNTWLPAGGWVAEGMANLSELPPAGATIVVGGPTVVGASGGPSRIVALV